MVPVNQNLIKIKLSKIEEDLERIKKYIKLKKVSDDTENFFIYQTLLERLSEVVIQRAIDTNRHIITQDSVIYNQFNDVATDYHSTFMILGKYWILPLTFANKIAQSARFRNFIVHYYDEVDIDKFDEWIENILVLFPKYLLYIWKYLK